MHTRCPECQTVFLITEQQLSAAGGKARCGRCGAVFDARAALLPEAGAETPASAQQPAAAPQQPAPSETPPPVEPAQPGAERPQPAPEQPPHDAIPAVLLADFEEQARAPRRRHGWAWALLILLLSATLALQYAYFARADLVERFPQARPWLVQLCAPLSALLDCTVPYPTRLGHLRMLSSAVSEHPTLDGALLLEATFVNMAPFTQPYPLLEVLLTDLRGAPVALRRFRPEEYLRDELNARQGLAPRTPVTALLEVTRPFADVNNYRFTFHRVVRKSNVD